MGRTSFFGLGGGGGGLGFFFLGGGGVGSLRPVMIAATIYIFTTTI